MPSQALDVVHALGQSVLAVAPMSIAIGAVFAILSFFFACNPGQPWWHKRGLVTDLCYWFVIPLFTRYVRIGMLVLGASLLFGITSSEALSAFYENGHGPLAQLPMWTQVILYLVASDFLLYWNHRAFHRGKLWKYHAIHHSSEDLDWISAARFHPANLFLGSVAVDVLLLLAGISPNVLVLISPLNNAHGAFVHANLNWTLGPFKYVIAGPIFHRWHHTGLERGGSKNFASTFPVWDLLFGTFYMPPRELPDAYGVAEPVPAGFAQQILYPFRV
jgi:sterol desaturase/sphingolipid hydroxylase (fatty acid hydroxylase superfamily)